VQKLEPGSSLLLQKCVYAELDRDKAGGRERARCECGQEQQAGQRARFKVSAEALLPDHSLPPDALSPSAAQLTSARHDAEDTALASQSSAYNWRPAYRYNSLHANIGRHPLGAQAVPAPAG